MNAETTVKRGIQDVFAEIEHAAAGADAETRYVHTMDVGEVIRQGDIYITRVDTNHPRGKVIQERQLAPGNSQGSRHVLEGDVDVYAPVGTNPLMGPVFIVRGEARVPHPEHAHVVIRQVGTFQVTYQRDLAAESIQRSVD